MAEEKQNQEEQNQEEQTSGEETQQEEQNSGEEAQADPSTDSTSSQQAGSGQEEQSQGDASTEEEVEVPEKFQSLVSQIEQMSVLDLSELVKILEKKFGVSAAAPVAAAGAAAPVEGEGEAQEEKSEFDVELTEVGDNKIGVIKALRGVTDMGLKDAKELVEGVPQVIKEGAKKEEADDMKSQLEEAGATVTLK